MKSKYALAPDFAEVEDSEVYDMSLEFIAADRRIAFDGAQARHADGVGVKEKKIFIESPDGYQIPVMVYSPADVKRQLPCIVNCHGGGYYLPIQSHQIGYSLGFAEQLSAVVLMPQYRLAPENPYPTGLEDCYTTLAWAFTHAGELGIDPERVAIFGDSSGGNFAAELSILARDRGLPALRLQMLIYPVTMPAGSTKSSRESTDTPIVNSAFVSDLEKLYLGSRATPEQVFGLMKKDLSGLPAAYVETAEFDPLHDEGCAYANALKDAGVPVTYVDRKGAFHAFEMLEDTEYVKAVISERIAVLKSALA